jgi:3-hydroxyisobutyrate dehydrogenase-like beta-hydroxyacid dehydrogenase
VIVDTSTMRVADKFAARDVLARAGAVLIDASVSTTPQALREGRLVLFASGDEAAFIAARPALEAFSGTIHFVGEFGNASRIKLICNLLVAIHNAATAEAMALVEASGLDAQLAHRVVSDGVASSKIWERRGAMMLDGDYGEGSFAYRIATHDAPLIDELSREVGAFTPMFRLAEHLHRAAIEMGLERYDTASMLELYRACRTTRES